MPLGNRVQAVVRLLVLVPAYLLALVLAPVLSVILGVAFVVDILLQLATGGRGLGARNLAVRVWNWYLGKARWLIFG